MARLYGLKNLPPINEDPQRVQVTRLQLTESGYTLLIESRACILTLVLTTDEFDALQRGTRALAEYPGIEAYDLTRRPATQEGE